MVWRILGYEVSVASHLMGSSCRQKAGEVCAKPTLEAACFRLQKHKKTDFLLPLKRAISVLKQ